MNQQISDWEKESNVFYEWFKSLGGNIADDEQMAEAFSRIEAKSISDSKLYQLLENENSEQSDIMPEYENWKESFNALQIGLVD